MLGIRVSKRVAKQGSVGCGGLPGPADYSFKLRFRV